PPRRPSAGVAGEWMEADPPWIAEAIGVDLGRAAAAREWVRGRDRIRAAVVDVDAQNLAEQDIRLGRVARARVVEVRVVAARHVEVAVETECDLPAVVIELDCVLN